ncbi:MAG: hypothetical protein J5496_08655 [Lachnospiraceae bacterium]|nr:hypothetical protein [Lachnospiraceae bacterium]
MRSRAGNLRRTVTEEERQDAKKLWLWLGTALGLILATALLAVSCSSVSAASEGGAALSLRKRNRLPEGSVIETAYYTDNLNWLGKNNSTVQKGLKYFYQETGVQPYLYLTNNIGLASVTVSREELQAYTKSLYRTLFKDEGHLLLVIFRNERLVSGDLLCFETGQAAASVIDEEALSILRQYYEAARADGDYEGREARMLSDVFRNTANNIMSVKNRSAWIVILVLILVTIAVITAVDFRRAWRKRKEEEARERAALQKAQEQEAEAPHEFYVNNVRKT